MQTCQPSRRRFLIDSLIVGMASAFPLRGLSSPAPPALTTDEQGILRAALAADRRHMLAHQATVMRYLQRYRNMTEASRQRLLRQLHLRDLSRQATVQLAGYLVTPAEWAYLESLLPS